MGDEIAIQAFAAQCVCGRRLALDPTQIGRHVVCPACSRVIIPVLAEATSIPARSLGDRGTFAEQAPATSSHESPPPTATAVDDSAPIIVLHLSQWDNFWKYLTCLMVEVLAGGLFLIPSLRQRWESGLWPDGSDDHDVRTTCPPPPSPHQTQQF